MREWHTRVCLWVIIFDGIIRIALISKCAHPRHLRHWLQPSSHMHWLLLQSTFWWPWRLHPIASKWSRPIRGWTSRDVSYSPIPWKEALWAITTKIFFWTFCRAGSALWMGWMCRFIQIPFWGLATLVVLLRSFCQSCGLQTLFFLFSLFIQLRFRRLSKMFNPW